MRISLCADSLAPCASCPGMDYAGEDSKKRKLNDASNGVLPSLSKDDLKLLLDPLSKEQLVNLLVDALLSNMVKLKRVQSLLTKLRESLVDSAS